jgi:hypothetical protein
MFHVKHFVSNKLRGSFKVKLISVSSGHGCMFHVKHILELGRINKFI